MNPKLHRSITLRLLLTLMLLLSSTFKSFSGREPKPALTHDIFSGDFPPASYRQTHEEIEATIEEVIEVKGYRDDFFCEGCAHWMAVYWCRGLSENSSRAV